MVQGSHQRAGRRHKAQVLFPGTDSVQVEPGAAVHSGIILFTRPVNMLEQCHGKGHSQDLKDKERGLKVLLWPGVKS